MREAAADLQGGGQDHRRGGMRPEKRAEEERGKGQGGVWTRAQLPLEPGGTKRRQMMIDEPVQAGLG